MLFLNSCAEIVHDKEINLEPRKNFFINKGFTLIFDDNLYKNKIVNNKLDSRSLVLFQKNLKKNTNVKITNLLNSKYIIVVVGNNSEYPYFYNSVITNRIAKELELDINEPYVEIKEILPNASFIAKKAVTYDEEKKVAIKVPIESIEIKDLSNNALTKKVSDKKVKFNYIIKIADFYFLKSAKLMKSRILSETTIKKVNIKKLSKTNFRVFIGPHTNLNSLKKSYNAISILEFDNIEIIKK